MRAEASRASRSEDGRSTTDEELLGEMAGGGEEALGLLYARHAPSVFGIAARALDAPTAEEVVQDVFLSAWRSASSFDPARGAGRTWLFAIARNRIANELRARSRRPLTEPEDAGDEPPADPGPDQTDALWRKRRAEILRRALRDLPPGERAALGLAYFEELPHREIASLLGIPLGTAKSHIRIGVARLRTSLRALVAAVAVGVLAAFLVSRLGPGRRALARDERALEMLTSSEAISLRLTAEAGMPSEAHATYRFRPGAPIAVLTFSRFPPAPSGQTDRAWAECDGRWVLLGEGRPDASGHARLIAEAPALERPPDRLVVTGEVGPAGAAPGGKTLVSWTADRK